MTRQLAAVEFGTCASLQLGMLVAVCPSSELICREGPTASDEVVMDWSAAAAAASYGYNTTCLPSRTVTRPRLAPDLPRSPVSTRRCGDERSKKHMP